MKLFSIFVPFRPLNGIHLNEIDFNMIDSNLPKRKLYNFVSLLRKFIFNVIF